MVSKEHVSELQYADDCALIAHTPEDLQHSLTALHEVYSLLGLAINPTKTEILYQWHVPPDQIPDITINDTALKITNQFVYLGAVISADCSADVEINSRISKALAAFSKIRDTVIKNHSLRLATKISVYRAICISVLLYGSETVTLYARHLKLLERTHIRCLKEILGLTWRDRVPHVDILRRAGLTSIECTIARNQLRWAGHVYRMPEHRYPKMILYGQLTEGKRPPHGPKMRYKDRLKKTMKAFNLPPENFEREAGDRSSWRTVCSRGAAHFEAE